MQRRQPLPRRNGFRCVATKGGHTEAARLGFVHRPLRRPLALPSRLQRLRQLWTVRSLPGLDLDKGCQDGPAMLACESLYGSSLSFQAKAALALSNGANP
jgi:hypothetical protein